MELRHLNISESDLAVYDLLRVYEKNEICIFANKIYISNSDQNVGDNPLIGIKWDQIL